MIHWHSVPQFGQWHQLKDWLLWGMKTHLRSLEVIQPSSYLYDPTIVKPKNKMTSRLLPQNKATIIEKGHKKRSKNLTIQYAILVWKPSDYMLMRLLYLISLSWMVEEYCRSRVTPWALRLSFSSAKALLCWLLSACRTGWKQWNDSRNWPGETAMAAVHSLQRVTSLVK